MEQRKPLSHVAVGLLISAINIIFYLVMMILGDGKNQTNPGSGILSYIVVIVSLIIFINFYAKAKNNNVSFGDLFHYGFKSTTVITIIMIMFIGLFSLIFPAFKSKSLEIMQNQVDKQNNISPEKADELIEFYKRNFWVLMIAATMLTYVILGAIGSLIGAAITKKRPQNPFEQQPL